MTGNGRWRALVGFAAFGGFWGTWGASLPRVQLEASVTNAQLGFALLWVGAGALVSIRWTGGLADRHERWVLPISIAALGLAGMVPIVTHGVAPLSLAMLLLGVCSGAADAAINAAAVRAETGGRPLVSLSHGVFSLSVVASSLGVAALAGIGTGRPWALMVVGVALIVAAGSLTRMSLTDASPVVLLPATKRLGLSWPLLVLGMLAAVAYFVENAWQSWGAIQLHATVGASLQSAALAPAVFASAAATSRVAVHQLGSVVGPAAVFGVSAAGAAGGSALAALGHDAGLVFAGIAVAGLGTGGCAPTLIALAGRVGSGRQGAATGTVITIAYLGFVLGPAIIGLVAGASTLPTALFAVAVIAAGLALASPLLTRLAPP